MPKSSISGESEGYNRYIHELIANENPHLQVLIQQELPEHISPEPLVVPADNELIRRLAKKADVEYSSPEFNVIIRAVNDFSIARIEAKKREAAIFSVEPPPPSYLIPVETKADIAKSTLLRYAARPTRELIQFAKVFKTIGIRDLVPLVPKREVLHQIAVIIISRYKASPGIEFDEFLAKETTKYQKSFLDAHPDLIQNVDSFRAKIADEVRAYLDGRLPDLDKEIKELVNKIREQVSKEHGFTEDEEFDVITKRVVDLASSANIAVMVSDHSTGEIDLKELPKQTKEKRRCFMVNGGIASGKGSAVSLMRTQASRNGVDLSDTMVINTDSYKLMLQNPMELGEDDRFFYSVLTHDEASVIRGKVMNVYRESLGQDRAPHLFVDQVFTAVDIVDMMGGLDQTGVDVTLVQIPVENSFKMAFSRGEATGRFEQRSAVIGTHKRVPDQLLETLRFAVEHKKVNIRLQLVKNIGPGQSEAIGFFDLSKREGEVANLEALRELFVKTQLNPDAHTFDDLYSLGVDKDAVEKKISEFTSHFEVQTHEL